MSTLFTQQQRLLSQKLEVLRRLQAGLQWSFDRLPPLTVKNINDPAVNERISAIVDRFCKLQDQFAGAMRHAHSMLGEKSRSFTDVITWAVEQGVLPSSQHWLELRSLRNRLTHEYDLESESLPDLITLVRDGLEAMNTSIASFDSVCRATGLLSPPIPS